MKNRSKYDKEYYSKNKEKKSEQAKKRYLKNKTKILEERKDVHQIWARHIANLKVSHGETAENEFERDLLKTANNGTQTSSNRSY